MRGRGGFIGANATPASAAVNSAAGGIWTLREAESLKRAGTWPTAPGLINVTGGTITTPGDGYTYHAFTISGTLQITGGFLTCDVLVVGAGGSGSFSRSGGGGGGGGVLYQTNQTIANGSYDVTVAPQTPLAAPGSGNPGGSSSIGAIYQATGGGGGISTGSYRHRGGTSGVPTTTSTSAGNAGGTGANAYDSDMGGGGGGAGGIGGSANEQDISVSPGGIGRTVFGVVYGRGGDGGLDSPQSPAVNGPANTGRGGSGGSQYGGGGGRGTGGSGVVIVRYLTA
jgi:hypothetical protein